MMIEPSCRDTVGFGPISAHERNGFQAECTNPFATRWTRPGAIPFDLGDEVSIGDLLERFWQNDCRGEIVGPHGSGKSTLLATIVPALEAVGRDVVVAQLHDGQRRLPFTRRWLAGLDRNTILVIDGYEQLRRWRRWRVLKRAERQGFGLLITSHQPVGLPLLYQMSSDVEVVRRLIERHLPPHGDRITSVDIERAWRRHPGNIRELFFWLYNVFEVRRSEGDL